MLAFNAFARYYQYMITIYSWNVNGIRAVVRKELFVPFITKENPDILCLQETKAKQGQAEIEMKGYEEYWNSADKAGYSGTAIFTKIKPIAVINGLPEDIRKKYDMTDDSYGDPNTEGRVTTAEFEKFYVVTVYTPNAAARKTLGSSLLGILPAVGKIQARRVLWRPQRSTHRR